MLAMNNFDPVLFKEQINTVGYCILNDVLSAQEIAQLKKSLELAIEKEVQYHQNKSYQDYGMVLLCSLYDKAFSNLLSNQNLIEPFNVILGDGCIVYAYTSSSMPPNSTNYSNRIHVDCPRIIPGYITNMGATILLDDFTEENGATWFLPSSQNSWDQPSEADFYSYAKRVIAPAGSVWYFNARIWHAGGLNKTQNWRHALTINMVRPWMKQRIDIPRAMADVDISDISELALQKLGFLAQVPSNYEEYYAPFESRKFKQKTE
jgi:ectoine hydroxylase-related dioxygenase (phytanoyl-CoA dioxygenase family)